MSFLGFVDDVLDLRWRYKMILPLFAGIPLIVAYRGPTTILVPGFVQTALGVPHLVDLGLAYHIYMMLLAIFCSNSINIYAGTVPFFIFSAQRIFLHRRVYLH